MMHDPIGPWPNAVFIGVYLLVIPLAGAGLLAGETYFLLGLVWAVATLPLHVAGVFGKGPWK